jgi:hypothetical protein
MIESEKDICFQITTIENNILDTSNHIVTLKNELNYLTNNQNINFTKYHECISDLKYSTLCHRNEIINIINNFNFNKNEIKLIINCLIIDNNQRINKYYHYLRTLAISEKIDDFYDLEQIVNKIISVKELHGNIQLSNIKLLQLSELSELSECNNKLETDSIFKNNSYELEFSNETTQIIYNLQTIKHINDIKNLILKKEQNLINDKLFWFL